ncbi:MAG: hypothetical protein WCC94_12605 [Candidatus Bathyarchaeia archaeon]
MGAAERGMMRMMERCIEDLAGKTIAGQGMEGRDGDGDKSNAVQVSIEPAHPLPDPVFASQRYPE